MRRISWTCCALVMAACSDSGPSAEGGTEGPDGTTVAANAPTELDELPAYLFRHLDDDAARAEGVTALRDLLGGADELVLPPLTDDDVDGVDHPGDVLDDLLAAAVLRTSGHTPVDHASHVALADQTVAFPDSYAQYDRTPVDGDLDELTSGSSRVRFTDDIVAELSVFQLPYSLDTVARWEGDVLLVRSTLPAAACLDEGLICLEQSFILDVYAPEGRLSATWSETTSGIGISDDELLDVLIDGIHATLDAEEAWLGR